MEFSLYAIGKAKKATAREFFAGMSRFVDLIARYVSADAPEVEACRAVLARSEATIGPTATGYERQLVPVFVCVARKS